jgi:hypothetical protein
MGVDNRVILEAVPAPPAERWNWQQVINRRLFGETR